MSGPRSLRARAMLAIAALALYVVAGGAAVSWQRAKMEAILLRLDSLAQAEATLARTSTFASQTLLKINEGFLDAQPARVAEGVAIDLESVSAGLGGLVAWYPAAGAMVARLATTLGEARRGEGSRGALIDLRAVVLEASSDLDQLAREVRARHESLWNGYRATYDSVTRLATALFLVGLAAFGATAMVFFRRLARDIGTVSTRAMDVVGGYRGAPLAIDRHDEVGALAEAIDRMQRILRERDGEVEMARRQRFHQEKMAALRAIAAAVAHEINNPVAALEGIARGIGPAGAPPGAAEMLQHTQRIAGITRRLAELTAQQSPQAQLVDLNALARATCGFAAYDPRLRTVAVELALDPAIPAAWAVADHVAQVLMDVLGNATEALQRVPVASARIVVRSAAEGRRVRLTVEDNGCGMDEATVAALFEASFQPRRPGAGSGLAVDRALLDRSGGNIEVDSRVGGGTRVAISLPTADPTGNSLT